MDKILHRVLSFDGGGIRGLYQASLIQSLKDRDLDVAAAADIIAGTSTGAIVAAALATGVGADAMTRLYNEVGRRSSRLKEWSSAHSRPREPPSAGRLRILGHPSQRVGIDARGKDEIG